MLFRIRKRLRFVFFTNAFFFIALGPALVRTGLGRGIFLSDRYVYLASYGLIFLLAGLLHWLMERKNWELKRQYLVYGIVAAIYGGMCFSYASKWDNGETLWTNTIDKYPSVSYAWVNRAKYYKDLGMHDKAMEDYSAALEIEDDLNGLIDRGIMLRDQGRYNESMADFERALAAKPDNEFALNGKGNLLFVMGRYQEAVEVYDKGIALYPGALSFLINRSAAYFYLGQVQSALSDLQRAQEINPGYPGINQKKTVMYMTIGDWNNAVASARLTAQEDPTNHANFGDLGQALQELGRHQEAIEAYTNAIQLNRQGKRYYQGRALSYSAVGNSQAASNDRQTARSL